MRAELQAVFTHCIPLQPEQAVFKHYLLDKWTRAPPSAFYAKENADNIPSRRGGKEGCQRQKKVLEVDQKAAFVYRPQTQQPACASLTHFYESKRKNPAPKLRRATDGWGKISKRSGSRNLEIQACEVVISRK